MATKKEPITQIATNVTKKADEMLAKGTDVYAEVKESAIAKYADAKEATKAKAIETRENAKAYVQKNPEKSIGIAAGIGALIGAVIALIITRRR